MSAIPKVEHPVRGLAVTTPRANAAFIPSHGGLQSHPLALAWRDSRYATLSLTALVSALLLIVVGNLVRISGNGLGCPDWPLCYGQVVPPLQISPWIEFSHRLVGAITSAQIIALGILAWRWYRREAGIIQPALAALGLLSVQVALGGLHVIFELPPTIGWIHTAVAMAIAALLAAQVAVTHPAARALSARAAAVVARDRGLPATLAMTAAATYLLVLTGVYVTRTGASLACPDFPSCGTELSATPSLALIVIQMFHRLMAFGVTLTIGVTLWRLLRAARGGNEFRAAALALFALLTVQFGLGIGNVLLHLPLWSRTLHLLVAALLWTGVVMLWMVLKRPLPDNPS